MRRTVLGVFCASVIWLHPTPGRADGIQSDLTKNGVRQIRGTLGEAHFQIAMPLSGNGKTLLYVSPHYLGNETSSDTLLKPLALARGWVYVASDEGDDQTSEIRVHWYDVKRGLLNLVAMGKDLSRGQYGREVEKTFIAGYSLGGNRTEWMLEQSDVFNGGLALAPTISFFESLRWFSFFGKKYDGSPESVSSFAMNVNGFQFDAGLKSSYGPPLEQQTLQGFIPALIEAAIQKFSPAYTGSPEMWDPEIDIPKSRVEDLRHTDETGWLRIRGRKAPLIVIHGGSDAFVSPGSSIAYLDLVKETIGAQNAHEVLRVFIIPEFTHLHFFEAGPPDLMAAGLKVTDEALTALEKWVSGDEAPESIGGITSLP